jgi:hypothetical protein
MIGHIVGDPDELIECEHGPAVPRVDQPRRDRKVLIPMALSGP